MKQHKEILKLGEDYAKDIDNIDGTACFDFVVGYCKCQEDMAEEIQSLIDYYKSTILKLEEEFKDGHSIVTLSEISLLQAVVGNLENILNKQD